MRIHRLLSLLVVAPLAAVVLAACSSSTADRDTSPSTTAPRSVAGEKYLAIGSSFASGPKIQPVADADCERSQNNYAHLVAQDLKLALTDATCSGATVQLVLDGTRDQLHDLTADTGIVTMTFGGNDLNYSLLTAACMTVKTACTAFASTPATTTLASKLRTDLGSLITKIHSTAPAAKIYIVSYPQVFADNPTTCSNNSVTTANSAKLQAIGVSLDQVFHDVATSSGATLVDVYAASKGHDVCADTASRWVAGSKTTGEKYHPNALGMQQMAALVEHAISGS
jgi:lysophospholipase L1-like esterase